MKKIPDQRKILDRRKLYTDLEAHLVAHVGDAAAARHALLMHLKQAVAQGRSEIERRFFTGTANGLMAGEASCFQIDQVLRVLFDLVSIHIYPTANPSMGEAISLVAIGGYGRGSLAPYSDIDLLFLVPHKPTVYAEQMIEFLLYMLWDLGFRVGQATRSLDDCLRRARADVLIRTAMMEARYVWGDLALYQRFINRFRVEVEAGTEFGFIEAKLAEREERHLKHGGSRYVLEPNIKEGKGGLRDLHSLYWISLSLHQTADPDELLALGLLNYRETQKLRAALRFLSGIRFHLHYLAGRAEERLTFDRQVEIAQRSGYQDRPTGTRVERFMKHYFLVAKDVGILTGIFCAAMKAEHRHKSRFLPLFRGWRKMIDGYVIEEGRLAVNDAQIFTTDPLHFIRLFHTAQTQGLEIQPATLRLITRNLHLIGPALCTDPTANQLFLAIMTSLHEPETTLRRLLESGVLARFVPDFGRVIAQMQYDMYHVYTVDEHTLIAIGILAKIETGRLADAVPIASDVIHKILSRQVLYVAVFLHDIAKGRPGDHSVVGAAIAVQLAPRFGLNAEETETVAWLVRWHLLMSFTAFKRDLDDPKTIQDFVDRVCSPERLRLLLVLTVCDIRAVGPKTWTEWKAQLLRRLYRDALALMQRGLGDMNGERGDKSDEATYQASLVREAQQVLCENLGTETILDPRLANAKPAYWLGFSTLAHRRHAKLLAEITRNQASYNIGMYINLVREIAEITVIAANENDLLPRMAGALAAGGATILEARVYTLVDGTALDSFTIQDSSGGPFDQPNKRARVIRLLTQALERDLDIESALAQRQSPFSNRTADLEVNPRVLIDNNASHTHTVIEVNGTDRPGLLWRVSAALSRLDLQIDTAKISTYGETAVDVFYVKNRYGFKIQHERFLTTIKVQLIQAVAADQLAAVEPS